LHNICFANFVLVITGSVGGILVKHHGCRKVAILGSIIATVGLATSPFNAAICTTISYTLWVEWYYIKKTIIWPWGQRSRFHEGHYDTRHTTLWPCTYIPNIIGLSWKTKMFNFSVFLGRSIIFGMWVHDHKAVCRIP
jgi:hypothetical protein